VKSASGALRQPNLQAYLETVQSRALTPAYVSNGSVTTGNALIEQKISGSASKADMPMAAVASLQVDGGS